jgi:hypothetical protein
MRSREKQSQHLHYRLKGERFLRGALQPKLRIGAAQ